MSTRTVILIVVLVAIVLILGGLGVAYYFYTAKQPGWTAYFKMHGEYISATAVRIGNSNVWMFSLIDAGYLYMMEATVSGTDVSNITGKSLRSGSSIKLSDLATVRAKWNSNSAQESTVSLDNRLFLCPLGKVPARNTGGVTRCID
jgi:hypothetical protein